MTADETYQAILDVLTEAHKADENAVRDLMAYRSICNDKLARHPDIPVAPGPGFVTVSALGLINGIAKRLTGKTVYAHWDFGSLSYFHAPGGTLGSNRDSWAGPLPDPVTTNC